MAYTLVWDEVAKKLYETGNNRGVLFPQNNDGTYANGVAWSGLTGIDESPSGADATDLWADDQKYLTLRSAEELSYTIKAYMYPPEFGECDGTKSPAAGLTIYQQSRRPFGFCYTSTLGNDVQNNDYGEKLHIFYNSTAAPSSRSYGTINDSPSAIEFSWECKTTPVAVTGYKNTAELVVDSTLVAPEKYEQLKQTLYGDGTNPARLPSPDEIIAMLSGSVTDAVPTGITIVGTTLTPEFDSDVRAYSAVASSASGKVTVEAATGSTIAITLNGEELANEGTATWDDGVNTLVITVSKVGSTTTTTAITVVYSA